MFAAFKKDGNIILLPSILLTHLTQSVLILTVIVLLIGFKTEQDYDHEQE
jgi:hypothetical protein